MPKVSSNFRIRGFSKDYEYTSWIQESLKSATDPLNYFSFADNFNNNEQNTNSHYSDLLTSLTSQHQTKKLIRLAQIAKTKFNKRNKSTNRPGFAQDYQKYWAKKSKSQTEKAVLERQQDTIVRLNDLTCQQIENRALEIYNNNESVVETYSSVNKPLTRVLNLSKQLSSDKVGHLNILDLSSKTVTDMLRIELSQSEFETIMQTRTLPPVNLAGPAQHLSDNIESSQPDSGSIREALYEIASPLKFNLILHHDKGFIEKTVRHFLDLVDSPKNPLSQPTKERTAAISTIIYIVNELFIAYNDIIELEWIENEHCLTNRSKWDGVLIKVDNKSVSVALVEFSGGCQFNATARKEASDINKLYQSLKVMIDKIPELIPSKVYCIRYYDNSIYFEHLFKYQNKYVRHIDCSFKCPTTVRLIKNYVKEVPKMFQWKEAVINQTLQYDG